MRDLRNTAAIIPSANNEAMKPSKTVVKTGIAPLIMKNTRIYTGTLVPRHKAAEES